VPLVDYGHRARASLENHAGRDGGDDDLMPLEGDISRMGQLAERVADLASVPSRASKRLAVELEGLVEEEFAAGADPYGNAWAPLTETTKRLRSQNTEPPLTDYGAMRASLLVKPMAGAGVAITIDPPADKHQTGWPGQGTWGDGPARPILPSGTMPARWREAIEVSVEAAVRR
jgi:hypothetical protein